MKKSLITYSILCITLASAAGYIITRTSGENLNPPQMMNPWGLLPWSIGPEIEKPGIPAPGETASELITLKNLMGRGKELFHQANYQDGIKVFTRIIEKDPAYVPGYRWLSRSLIRTGNYTSAAAWIEKGLRMIPDDMELLILSGKVKRAAEDYQGAVTALHTAAALQLKAAEAYLELAGLYYFFGLPDEAFFYRSAAEGIINNRLNRTGATQHQYKEPAGDGNE